jgi:hypothetical protein
MTSQQQGEFRRGTKAVLNYLEGFWIGLEASNNSQAGIDKPLKIGFR